jgi:hypothetical protein
MADKPHDFYFSDHATRVLVGCYYKGYRWSMWFSTTGIPELVVYRNPHHRFGPGDPGYVPTKLYSPQSAKVVHAALCADAPRCLHEAELGRIARVKANMRAVRRGVQTGSAA